MLSLAQAAKAAGKSKPTVQRAIKMGKLSATRRDDGSYEINPAELHRVYPFAGPDTGTMKQHVTDVPDSTAPVVNGYLDQLLREYQETIRDLRARLDASEAERRALLTDQRGRRWRIWPWRNGRPQ